MDTAWMPYMWPIKASLWFGIVFLLIQGVSELFKSYWAATKGKWPGDRRIDVSRIYRSSYFRFYFNWCNAFFYICWISNFIYINFFRFCIWLLRFGKLVFYLMTLQFSMVMTEQTLAAVPLFVFMGIMMEQAGLMERLFSAFQLMLAKVRGSLILCCFICFSGICCCYRNCWSISYYFRNYGG